MGFSSSTTFICMSFSLIVTSEVNYAPMLKSYVAHRDWSIKQTTLS